MVYFSFFHLPFILHFISIFHFTSWNRISDKEIQKVPHSCSFIVEWGTPWHFLSYPFSHDVYYYTQLDSFLVQEIKKKCFHILYFTLSTLHTLPIFHFTSLIARIITIFMCWRKFAVSRYTKWRKNVWGYRGLNELHYSRALRICMRIIYPRLTLALIHRQEKLSGCKFRRERSWHLLLQARTRFHLSHRMTNKK